MSKETAAVEALDKVRAALDAWLKCEKEAGQALIVISSALDVYESQQ